MAFPSTGGDIAQGVRAFAYPAARTASTAEALPSSEDVAAASALSREEAQRAADIEQENIRKQAFQEGYAEGQSAGEERATARFREATVSFGDVVQSLAGYKTDLRLSTQRELVSLALAVAQRVLHREVTVDPSVVLGIVRACLDEFSATEINRLGVHPRDYKVVSGYFQSHPIPNLEVVSDPAVGPGGAIFETSQGRIDARVETQLKEIEHGLADG
ncbi:MAG: FliH/SctL family protein [Acidobacteria bacterium]|nr:FliH/SctL family protein [Acidobacteriota bacterium]